MGKFRKKLLTLGAAFLAISFFNIASFSGSSSRVKPVSASYNSKYGCLDVCSGKSGYFYIQGWVYNKYHATSGSKRYVLLEYPQEAYRELPMRDGESAVADLNAMRFGGNIPIKSGTYSVVVDINDGGWARFVSDITVTVSKPTVTFDKQGGTGGTGSAQVDYSTANPNITVPSKTGYTFQGYYTGTNGTGTKYYKADGKSAKNWAEVGGATLYAYWTAKNYTLTANANNGSITATSGWTGTGTSATKSVAYDSSYGTLPNVSRTGYTLKGWYTASTNGTQISTSTKMQSTSGSTIYAQWTANTYTVVYNGNNNTGGSMSSSSHTYDSSKNLTSNGFTRTGYAFAGWATTSNGEVKYSNGQSVKNLTSTNNGTVNLYAKWTANSYAITYKDKGNSDFSGTHESGYPTTHTYASSTTLMSATKTGFIFEGWYDSQDCSGSPVTSLGATAYTADITLYGKWSVDPAYKPTAVSQIGGFTYVEGTKRQVVGFGFQVDSNVYNLLVNDSDFGVIAYKSGSLGVEYSKGNIADLILNEGRFYLSLTFNDISPVTYYAKAFVKINGNYIYSDLVSASGNLVGQEYSL